MPDYRKKVKVIFKHWKTGEYLQVVGELIHDNPESDRIVIRKYDGSYEDIIKETVVTKEVLL